MTNRHRLALAVGLVALLGALVGSPVGVPAQASAPVDDQGPTIMVMGDSITGRHYTRPGRFGKGWYEYVADATDAPLIVSAEGGSGFVRRGQRCRGTTFAERLDQVERHAPDFVIVAGGTNDAYYCDAKGQFVYTPTARLRRAVKTFLRRLVAITDRQGTPRDHIYVFMPWGPDRAKQRPRIREVVKKNVERSGATYVPVALLPAQASYDGVHPTPAGSEFIFEQFAGRSDFLSRF